MSHPRLDPEALMAEAARATGLSDFGGDAFRPGLEMFCASLARQPDLNGAGWLSARGQILSGLENRLRMTEDRRRHPEIADVEIRRPIFVLGLPRSGTSILHELLRRDPAHRVPLSWEVRHPSPPPETATYETDPRIAQAAEAFDALNDLVPRLRTMVRVRATSVTECSTIMAHEFTCDLFDPSFHLPDYRDWLWKQDLRAVYEAHRRFLQHLQWRCPRERWVLKAPTHLRTLRALMEVYPDACIVWNHRDPLRSLASVVDLRATMLSVNIDHVQIPALARWVTSDNWEWLERGMEQRVRARESAFFDFYYDAFMGDSLGTIRRLYEHFGLGLSEETAGRMRAYLRDHPQGQHGRHEYSFEALGLDIAEERRRYAPYQQRFGVQSEF